MGNKFLSFDFFMYLNLGFAVGVALVAMIWISRLADRVNDLKFENEMLREKHELIKLKLMRYLKASANKKSKPSSEGNISNETF